MAVTNGKAWREKTYEVEFPSGNTARLRPLSGEFLVTCEHVPEWLVSITVEMMRTNLEPEMLSEPENRRRWHAGLNAICEAMFVEPRIVEEPTNDDEISLANIDDWDKAFLFGLVGKGAQILESFRPQQGKNVARMAVESGLGGQVPVTSPESSQVE